MADESKKQPAPKPGLPQSVSTGAVSWGVVRGLARTPGRVVATAT
jgi:hypothetical protein